MGIFSADANIWNIYRASLQFRGKLNGGVPKNPAVIEGWLRSKAGISDTDELREAMRRTLLELGADVRPDMSYEALVEASKALAGQQSTNGFKRCGDSLCIEGRQIKALLKEATNAYYAGDEGWGPTRKGPMSYVAERLFIAEEFICLGRSEPDGVDLSIGHITGPQGRRSTLTYYEYVEQPRITFHVMEAREIRSGKGKEKQEPRPSLTHEQWAVIWTAAEELGLGARRSQEQGKFDIVEWERVAALPSTAGEKVLAMA